MKPLASITFDHKEKSKVSPARNVVPATIISLKVSKCRFRTSLSSGIIMKASKIPFRMWYLAMALMNFSKKEISAKEMQRQLVHKYYEPV